MKYKIQKLKDFTVIRTGKLDSNAAVENGAYPFFTCDPQTLRINKCAYNTEAVLLAGNNASGNYTAKYYCGKFNAYQRTYIIETADSDRLNVRFLCYAINQQLRLLKTMSSGSTTKFLTIRMLHNLDIPCPEIEVQNRIVNVLGTIDDLIENNQKQIKLLEEAAQRLYKEWFVDLRFPGHEETPIVDGVPAGWERKSIEDIADYLNGYAFKPSDWGKSGKPIIKIKELNEGITQDTPRNSGENIPVKYIVYPGEIIFSWSATLTAKIWDGEIGLLNQHLFKVTPYKGIAREFVLQSILWSLDEFHNLTTGSTMKHIQRGKLKQVFVNMPNEKLMKEFGKQTDFCRKKILLLNHKIQLLQESRDRLLPKLMSGEIEV